MKIILFGSNGILGQYLKDSLKKYDLRQFTHNDVDILDFDTVDEIIKNNSPDIVVNATAYNDVELSETPEGSKKASMINGEGVGNLAKLTNMVRGIFIHFSTDYVFDGKKKVGYNEDAYPSPINKYGISKLLGERLTQNSTKRFYVIRMSRLFGNPGSSTHSKKSFVDVMLDSAKEKKEVSVINDEISSPTYALDVARITENILTKSLPFGVYHVANSGQCSWYEFALEIFSLCKIINPRLKIPNICPISSVEFKRTALRPKFSVLLNTKLPPLRDWKIALEDYLKTRL